ncbi:HU family DNA-binding protein, partial [Parabacteroides goldsteinii]
MNKADLINKIAARLSVPQKECREHLEALQTVIAEELNEGNGIILQGFGCFNLW